ncbi:MAG TPA: helix-turn-helix transcriptional regulator [Gemmataceae bacterium]|nr:helix-turn-helix transcriptional regulator [Gemmataceae bacterium]
MTFGEKLKELRAGRGLTQERLADAAGVPVGTIRDYEQGKRDPLLSNAQRLAGALGVSLDVFPGPEGNGIPAGTKTDAFKPRGRKPKGK